MKMTREQRYEQSFARAAVQLRFVAQEALDEAVGSSPNGWGSVSQRLLSRGLLTDEEAAAIAAVVDRQLARSNEGTSPADPAATRVERPAAAAPVAAAETYATSPLPAKELHDEWRRFAVLRPHAQGGLGRVQIARDQQLSREIALKEILPTHADNPTSRQRFVREAEITGALEHPGVVPVYSLGEYPDGRPFYAMRLIVGQNMRASLAEFHQHCTSPIGSDVRSRQLLGQFVDACQAIHYAHNRGVVHRDVKPENILAGAFGEAVLLDWGVAKVWADAASEKDDQMMQHQILTDVNQRPGTPLYMSPEQVRGGSDDIDARTDVYSAGAVLYEMLTLTEPLRGKQVQETFQKIVNEMPAPPRERAPQRHIPAPLADIAMKAMAKRPENRFQTMEEMIEAIRGFRGRALVSAG